MPDRTATPEEQLDQWLDALNEPGAIPTPPVTIAGLAEVALDCRRALAPNGRAATPERNGRMYHAQTLATPNGATWRVLARPERRRIDWGSWLATAAVMALLVGLVGGAAMRTWGLPGRHDPSHLAGIAASPAATPAGTLSCASPGYLPIVRGDADPGDLTVFGGPDGAIRATDDGVFVPLSNGMTRDLPADSFISSNSDVALAIHGDNSATVTRISTGETWQYPAVTPRLDDQTWDFFSNGRYVIGPTDDSRTDWLIIDTLTGDTRSTADILGEPFDGPLDPLVETSSENGELWIIRFAQVFFSVRGETPPAEQVSSPGYLIIPDNLDDAWFSDRADSGLDFEIVASPEGTSFISTQTVRDVKTGERLDPGEDNLTFFGDLIGYLDESTLLSYRDDVVNAVDIHTGVTTPVYAASDDIQAVGWDRDARMLVVVTGTGADAAWTRFDLATGDETPLPALDGYTFSPYRDPGYVVGERYDLGTPGEGSINTQVMVDVATGEIVATTTGLTAAPSRGWPYGEVAVSERFVAAIDRDFASVRITDRASGESWSMAAPVDAGALDGIDPAELVVRLEISPAGGCLVLNVERETGREGNAVHGAITTEHVGTWVATIEPGATWTALPFALDGWWKVQTDEPQVLPAQDFATPAVTPDAAALSCASPEYMPVVRGDVDADVLASIGATDAIVRGDTTTITAANGSRIEFGPDEIWTIHWDGGIALSGESEQALNTVTSLATGQPWTFPVLVEDSPQSQAAFMLLGGPWLIGAADDTATDWRIVNTLTGEERLTSDIFGAPFGQPPLPIVAPWLDRSGPTLMIAFSGESPTPSVVLPSGDLDDAWALPTDHVFASATGVITPDGSRIAYFRTSADDASSVVIVLDGFSGEEIATWPGPGTGDILQPVGLTDDGGQMILRDNQRVWTVDLATGEIATVFDPGGDIRDFSFDPTTGTALASSDGDAFFWIDPATDELKPLDIPVPMRFPQPQFGWALIQMRDDIAVDYALLDMTTGEIVTEPIAADRDENGANVWITGGDDTGVFVVQAESGRMLVLDGPGAQSFSMATPETGRSGWNGIAIGVSPNGGCLVYTEVGRGDAPGTSWIAPLEPDAAWTELPFELGPWIEMPPAPEDPAATPAPTETSVPTVTSIATEAEVVGPVPATPPPAPEVIADPGIVSLLPDNAIPVVAAGDPDAVDQSTFGTVGGLGPDATPGITIPLSNGEVLELPNAIAIAQLPRIDAALVTNDDGSRQTVSLTSGEILVDDLPSYVEGEQWVGHYLLVPGRDGTIWRVIDLLTGDSTDTATLGGGPFDREVTVVPMPSPADAPRNVVIQFAF